jgi:hypothetical protein
MNYFQTILLKTKLIFTKSPTQLLQNVTDSNVQRRLKTFKILETSLLNCVIEKNRRIGFNLEKSNLDTIVLGNKYTPPGTSPFKKIEKKF